jgi:manganese transport protein
MKYGQPPDYSAPAAHAATAGHSPSLEGLHDTVAVPHSQAGFWKQWRAFVGPALLISIGYMDPGNWGTDLAAGANFKYGLLWVVALASLMAIFLQVLAARLGVVAGKDLAQCCRDWYPKWTRWPNWLLCELAIGACDLAEVLGSAVAINLLTHNHITIFWAVILTAGDVLLLLALQRYGMRKIESVVLVLISTIAICYFVELFVIPQTKPSFLEMGRSLIAPGFGHPGMLYVAIGIIGATVMPHNLYLHSALVQSRMLRKDDAGIGAAIRFNTIDSVVALMIAFLVNAAILVLAAMVFYGKSSATLADGTVVAFNDKTDWIRIAYLTLAPLLGVAAASPLFAIALLASGQASTITGTLAGQVVMEGFIRWKLTPWVRRIITRILAIVPAILIIGVRGDGSVNELLNLSQVALALQLPLAMFPLLHFTSSYRRMGKWKSGTFLLIAGWTSAIVITALDVYGLPDALKQAWQVMKGS